MNDATNETEREDPPAPADDDERDEADTVKEESQMGFKQGYKLGWRW
jgi:hypothetical protein